ncbi:MAG: hypothetical protein ACE5OZ_18610 [Candidatus Heimdallarchaeota archaeon]
MRLWKKKKSHLNEKLNQYRHVDERDLARQKKIVLPYDRPILGKPHTCGHTAYQTR